MTAEEIRLKCLELARHFQVPGSMYDPEAMVRHAQQFEDYVNGDTPKAKTKK